jgi:hypothetical protein
MQLQFLVALTVLWSGSPAAQSLPSESIADLRAGGYVLVMRHAHSPTERPNLRAAFGDEAGDMADGETLILRPDEGGVVVVGRVRIDEWSSLTTG